GDPPRGLIELRTVAERPRHAAAAGVRGQDLGAGLSQELDVVAATPERFLVTVRVRQHLPGHLRLKATAVQEFAERDDALREPRGARVAAKELVQLVAEHGKATRLEHHDRNTA